VEVTSVFQYWSVLPSNSASFAHELAPNSANDPGALRAAVHPAPRYKLASCRRPPPRPCAPHRQLPSSILRREHGRAHRIQRETVDPSAATCVLTNRMGRSDGP
jgi:hypothetical protein